MIELLHLDVGVDPGDENSVGDNCTIEPPVAIIGVSAETGEGEPYIEYIQ